ncbi:alpha/beta fold hydrolase [Bacillus oleivorans]|nr:alpha/beta hydrolase [Bacillus oleivorans]
MNNLDKKGNKQVGLVFIHGAGLDSRIWEQVTAGLKYPFLLIDFPQQNERKNLTLQDYTVSIKRQIEGWEVKRFVIVAHSLGGVLALKVAHEMSERLVGMVAIGAVIPDQGRSFFSVYPLARRLLMGVLIRIFGTKPPEAAIRKGLCNDLTSEQAAAIVSGFVPESIQLYTERVGVQVPNVSKLYVKLMKDNELHPTMQNRMIVNLVPQNVEVLDAGHLPMLSKPNELRLALETFLTQLEIQH